MATDLIPWLSIGANVAQLVTGAVASIVGGTFIFRRFHRRRSLEAHLKSERENQLERGTGSRSVMHLISHLAMTEEQILEAAFTSGKVRRSTAQDPETGRASALFLQYDRRGSSN